VTSSVPVSGGAWHDLQVHLVVAGASSQVETWLDGVRVTTLSRGESLGSAQAVGRIQFGDATSGKTFTVSVDDVTADTAFVDQ
jgi:hypothetical protein